MASLGQLVVDLEANISEFQRDMGRAAQQTEQTMGRMERASAQTDRAMRSLQTTANFVSGAVTGVMSGLSVQKLVEYSDGWTSIENRIKLVTDSSQQLAAVQGNLFDIAQRNKSGISETTALYIRLAQSSDALGASQKEMIKFTDGVTAAVRVSGSGTADAAGALQQLSQAMSNAKIQAEEYNSINDVAPEILRAVARNIQGVDGDLGRLRQRMLDGELTSKEFFSAFLKDVDSLTVRSQDMETTVAQAFTTLNNEAMKFVGESSKASGAGQAMAGTITTVAKNLDTLSAAAGGLLVYKVSEWALLIASSLHTKATALIATRAATIASAQADVASTEAQVVQAATKAALIAELRAEALATLARTNAVIQSAASDAASTLAMQSRAVAMAELAALGRAQAVAQTQLTAATTAATAAQAGLNATTIAGASAAGVARSAIALLGGPIGAITTILGVGAAAWLYWGNSAKESQDKAKGAVEKSTIDILNDLDNQIKKLRERNALAKTNPELAKQDSEASGAAAAIQKEIDEANAGTERYAGRSESMRALAVINLTEQLDSLKSKLQVINLEKGKSNALDEKAATDKWLAEYATKAEKLEAKLKEIRATFKDGVIPPEIEKRVRESFADKVQKPKKTGENDEATAIQETEKLIARLREQRDTYGLAGAALLEYQLNQSKTPAVLAEKAVAIQQDIDKMDAATQAQNALAEAQKKAQEEAFQAQARNASDVEQIRQSLMTDVQFEQAQHQTRLDQLRTFHDARLENVTQANALIEAENQRHAQVQADMQLSAAQNLLNIAQSSAGQLYDALKAAGMEQTALGKAMFWAQKAIQVATIIVNTEVAAAAAQAGMIAAAGATAAVSGPAGPAILAAGIAAGAAYATATRVMGYATAGIVAGTAIASAEGGYDIPAGVNPVTQLHEKEMVLPKAQAEVIRGLAANGGAAGGGNMKLTIVNQTTGRIDSVVEQRISATERALIIQESVAATAAQFGDPNSKVSRGLARNFNVPRTR
ncbi:tape measure protein [Telluria sp. B2]